MTDEKRTIIAVKIRGGRLQRDLWSLAKILGALELLIGGVSLLQLYICKRSHPERSVQACLAPLTLKETPRED